MHPHPRGVLLGDELDYVEQTTGAVVTATSEASPQDVVVGNSIYIDGSTRIRIEGYIPYVDFTSASIITNLWEDSTNLGRISFSQITSGYVVAACQGYRYRTPAVGVHQYKMRIWKINAGACNYYCGSGGAGNAMPAYLRVTRA